MSHTPIFSAREIAQFRLSRAILAAAENTLHKTYEGGLLRDYAEQTGRMIANNGFFVPFELLKRDLNVSTAGALVAIETPAAVDVLRPASRVLTAGAQMYDVTGDVSLPRVAAPGSAAWLPSDGVSAASPTQAIIGALSMVPKNLVSLTTVSHQLRAQVATLDAFIARELQRTTATALDLAVLSGSGVSGEPQGIHGSTGVDAVSGASLDWADVLGMCEAVNAGNGQSITFIAPPAIETLLGNRERITGGARAIWDDGLINGRRAYTVTGAPAATLTAGDFGQVVIGTFGDGLSIEVDPFSGFNSGAVSFRSWLTCDVGILMPAAFSVATSVS